MNKRLGAVFVGGALLGVIGTLVSRAGAGGVPATGALRYSGKLENAQGEPVTGEHALQINLWKDSESKTPLCLTDPQKQKIEGGYFSILLPDRCADFVHEHADLLSEVLLDGVSMGKAKLGAVPYALEAAHATHADSASTASGELQTTLDSLSRKTRLVSARDTRNGCPPMAAEASPLLTLEFTLSKETAVHVTGHMIRLFLGRADLEVVVDDMPRAWAITLTHEMNWVTANVSWSDTLGAGDHTVVLRGKPDNPKQGNIWGCGEMYGSLTALLFE